MVSEIYTPPRVIRAARILTKLEIIPGFAMDITTNDEDGEPWNFDLEEQKRKAEATVIDTEPDFLVGSPMCKDFSPWQRLNEAKSDHPEKYQEARESSREHLKFVCRNYQHQYDAGRLFLHEHPQQASSWNEVCMRKFMSLAGVSWVDMHQCQLGQNDGQGNPVKKPTRWLSNSKHILEKLNVKCPGRGGWCFQYLGCHDLLQSQDACLSLDMVYQPV